MGNIIFDFWGTLAYLTNGPDFGKEISKLVRIKKEEFHKLVKKYWFKREISPEEFAKLLITKTNSQVNIEDLVYWIENPISRARLYDEVTSSLERLRKKNDLYLVSDASTVGKIIINNLNITHYFQQVVLSCENGITKSEGLYNTFFRTKCIDRINTLVIGDSLPLDYDIPIKLGVKAILIDREKKLRGYDAINSLEGIE